MQDPRYAFYKRGYYAPTDQAPNEFSMSYKHPCGTADAEWFQFDYFLSGDYCGAGLVAEVNRRILFEQFAAVEGVLFWQDHGSHGSKYVWFHRCILTAERGKAREIREFIGALEDYPCADDELHSELEIEEEGEEWSRNGAREMRRCLVKLAPHHDDLLDRVTDGVLYEVWADIAESKLGGERCVHEQCGAYFPFDLVFGDSVPAHKWLDWSDVRPILIEKISDARRWAKERAS